MTTTIQIGPSNKENLIDAKELAVRLGMEYRTILRWAEHGRIPSLKISGACRRFLYSDVVRHLGAKVVEAV